jgi:hypothetical protein
MFASGLLQSLDMAATKRKSSACDAVVMLNHTETVGEKNWPSSPMPAKTGLTMLQSVVPPGATHTSMGLALKPTTRFARRI